MGDAKRDSEVGRASARPVARESSEGGLKSALLPDDETITGLPGLRTWPAVYVAVLGVFVVWVALLSWLSAAFK